MASSRSFCTEMESHTVEHKWTVRNAAIHLCGLFKGMTLIGKIPIMHTKEEYLVYVGTQTQNYNYWCVKIATKSFELSQYEIDVSTNIASSTDNSNVSITLDEPTKMFCKTYQFSYQPYISQKSVAISCKIRYFLAKEAPDAVTVTPGPTNPSQSASTTPRAVKFDPKKKFNVARNLIEMYKSQKHCDVTVKIGDEETKAHILILAAASPYFDSIFKDKTSKESIECSVDLSEDPDVKMETMRAFLDYIYGCKNIHELGDHAQQLILLARKFDVRELKSSCEYYLAESLCPDSAIDVLILSENHSFDILREKALSFIKANKEAVKEKSAVRKLAEYPHLMLDLLF